jgi:2'-5' RNA ligase
VGSEHTDKIIRAFIAHPLEDEKKLLAALHTLTKKLPIRPYTSNKVHITQLFFKDLSSRQAEIVIRTLENAAEHLNITPEVLNGKVEQWGNKWVLIFSTSLLLHKIHEYLRISLAPHGLSPKDAFSFTPHVTLGRIAEIGNAKSTGRPIEIKNLALYPKTLCLYQSVLDQGNSGYRLIHRTNLTELR